MPITNGVFSNRYQEQEDYEYFCGAEFFPYIIINETEEVEEIQPSEPSVIVNKTEEKGSFIKRVLAMIKFKLFQI